MLQFVFLGVLAGVFTGLIPGIHVNLISLLALTFPFQELNVAVFIIAMAVTHTFIDIIPAVYLGAPDPSTALGVLPGHRYMMQGWGYQAVKLTLVGSLSSLFLSLMLMPLAYFIVTNSYDFIKGYMAEFLIAIALFMVLKDKKRFWSVLVFCFSGLLGYHVLNSSIENPLFAMLTGLFGISTLLYSLRNAKIPLQLIQDRIKIRKNDAVKGILSSTIAGFLTSMLPGIGSAQGAVIASQLSGKIGDHGFMILLGGVNTVNFILSLITLLVVGKARNGAVVAVDKLIEMNMYNLILFSAVVLVSGCLACIIGMYLARLFANIIGKVNYRIVVLVVISFLLLITPILSGFKGIIVILTATCLGLIPAVTKCSRTHAMACIIVPVILWLS